MYKTIIYLALCLSSITTALPTTAEQSIVERDAPAITFKGCTQYEIMALDGDLNDMVTLANNALNNIGVSIILSTSHFNLPSLKMLY